MPFTEKQLAAYREYILIFPISGSVSTFSNKMLVTTLTRKRRPPLREDRPFPLSTMSLHEIPGWIKLHRRLWANPFMRKPSYLSVWLWLLTHASHIGQDGAKARRVVFNGQQMALSVGQLLCGSEQISRETGVPDSTVRRYLKHMENERQIERQSDNRSSLVTIVNWHQYQDSDRQNEQPLSSSQSTGGQQVSTNEDQRMKNI